MAQTSLDKGADSAPHRPAGELPWLKFYPPDVDWNTPMPTGPLYSLLDHSAEHFGTHPCTYFLGKVLTFADIKGTADRIAKGLQALGIGPGKQVGLFLPNTPTYVVFYFGVLKAGGTVVNFNPLYSLEELEFQIRDAELDMMVTLDLKALFPKIEALMQSGVLKRAVICPFAELLPGVKSALFRVFKRGEISNWRKSPQRAGLIAFADVIANDGEFTPVPVDPDNDIAVLQYTGGTTGTPKGAMLTHANLLANVAQMVAWAPELEEAKERIMGILPFFHVFAMTAVMNFAIARAGQMILMPRFELQEALRLIDRTRPTVMPGVPTLFNAIMNYKDIAKHDLSSLKLCISGGAALPIEIKRGFEKISGCTLVEGYGLSETSPVTHCNPLSGPVREGSIGLPMPQTMISIRSLDDPQVEMPLGEKGELCVRGPQVMKSYWRQPEETEMSFTDGYFRTGDVGYIDEDGFTYIVDRLKDIIIASGFNIYPRRIEEAIYEHPAVEEVTVIGIPDEYRGEAPKAFIKLCQGAQASATEILEFLKPKLSKIEMPAEIEFRETLPKTLIGKLSKKELRGKSE